MSRFTRRAILPITLPLFLLACGQSPSSTDDLGPYANGARYPWSYTAQPGRITPLTLDPGRNNLYYEPILSAANGWGPVEINKSNGEQARGDGRTLTVQGRTWDVGYGVHSEGYLAFSIRSTLPNVTCTKIDGFVGVDDEVGDRGSVVFQLFLDDTKVWDSGVMTGKDAAKYYSIDLQGRTNLRMVVTDGGDNVFYDHANWLQPTVHCEASNTTPDGGPGTLDPSFDGDGQVLLGDQRRTSPGEAHQQPDGKLIITGAEDDTPDGFFTSVLFRLNLNGSLDTTFGTQGKLVPTGGIANYLRMLPDGRFLIGINRGSGSMSLLERYSRDGQLDVTFGSGGQVVLSGDFSNVGGLPDGGALVSSGFRTVRYTSAGVLDPSFAGDGVLDDALRQVLPDGKFLATGTRSLEDGSVDMSFLRRYTADGRLDTTFDQDGRLNFPRLEQYGFPNLNALLPSNGKLLLNFTTTARSGSGENTVFTTRYWMVRLNDDGSYDATFGDGGLAEVEAIAFGLVGVQPDGKIVTGLRRLNSDGSLDPSYKIVRGPNFQSASMQADGKLVHVGSNRASDPTTYRILVQRFLP